jgi:hypothetical protein
MMPQDGGRQHDGQSGPSSAHSGEECPACGGAGGGPFGRANSGWDIETYECPRCEGWGYIRALPVADEEPPVVSRPGIAKATPAQRVMDGESERSSARSAPEEKKRRTGARRE